jgi:hypothetical protein
MYKIVDLRLRKDFPAGNGMRVGVTADLFNAFNWSSYSYSNSGGIGGIALDPRRFQIGAEYTF